MSQKINVNTTPGQFMPTLYYSQGDIGREFQIALLSSDGWSIPAGATVEMVATKPSGFGFTVSGTLSDNTATFVTTETMTNEWGRFPAEVRISSNGDVIGTANFYLSGERDPHPAETIDGDAEEIIPELTLLVERVEAAASSVLDMTVVANTLPAGSDATYSYDEETNTATFGIPKGADGSLASGVLAPTYSSSSTYAVGDYVYYSGNLYRCTTAITTAEAWTSGHWTQVALAPEVSDVKSDIREYNAENVLRYGEQVTKTHNSTTFTWSNKENCHVKCTASTHSVSLCNIYYSVSSLPSIFQAGRKYYLKYSTTVSSGQRCLCDIWVFRNGNTNVNSPDINININRDTEFLLPSDATGIVVRLRLIANYTVEEDIHIALLNAKTNLTLEEEISNNSPWYGLSQYTYSDGTHNGVTYTWDADHNRCHAKGTAGGNSFRNVYYSATELPLGLKAGDKFGVLYHTTNEHLAGRITYPLADGTYAYSPYFSEPIMLTIPNNAVGMFLRFNVVSGHAVDDYVSVPWMFKVQTQMQSIPFKSKKPLMVSFIDDDTSTDELVTKFYQNCKHNGIVGSFAVCTKQYIDGDSTISELLSYEYDGFNLIPHCYEQKTYLQPTSEDYDIVRARENYFQCLRDFITHGIRNPQNLWIIPYGSQDKETSDLAKDLGFDMAFTTLGLVNNYLTWNNKFGMHRCGLSALADVTDDTSASATGSMAKCKARIDELVASETGGWAIFTTHFNEWDSETWDSTLDGNGYPNGYSRFNELVQYAITQGCEIVSMAQGSAYMKPIIDRNFTMG